MSWHYLQEQEAVSWAGSCSAGAPFALSRLMPTAEACCSLGNGTDCSSASPSGMTSGPSTASPGEGTSMSSAGASLVRTSRVSVKAPASLESGRDSGLSSLASYARYDPCARSWKTPQCSFIEELIVFSGIWPRWGLMRAGECWELASPARHTHGSACGLWPTPLKQDSRHANPSAWELEHGRRDKLHIVLGWKVHPNSSEWLMGWPIAWTDLAPLETAKFQRWFDSHGRR